MLPQRAMMIFALGLQHYPLICNVCLELWHCHLACNNFWSLWKTAALSLIHGCCLTKYIAIRHYYLALGMRRYIGSDTGYIGCFGQIGYRKNWYRRVLKPPIFYPDILRCLASEPAHLIVYLNIFKMLCTLNMIFV